MCAKRFITISFSGAWERRFSDSSSAVVYSLRDGEAGTMKIRQAGGGRPSRVELEGGVVLVIGDVAHLSTHGTNGEEG